MTAEYENEKGIWVPRPGMENKNHPWDVSVYGLAIADVAGIRFWPRDVARKLTKRAVEGDRKPARKQENKSGSWIRSKGYQRPNWLNNR